MTMSPCTEATDRTLAACCQINLSVHELLRTQSATVATHSTVKTPASTLDRQSFTIEHYGLSSCHEASEEVCRRWTQMNADEEIKADPLILAFHLRPSAFVCG
jgi:hypothetical protein